MNQSIETIYDVHWEGPFTLDSFSEVSSDDSHVLYAIYSIHPLYGKEALVYIGLTEQKSNIRINQHYSSWLEDESGEVKIYIASIGLFTTWDNAIEAEIYNPPKREVIEAIEALLILSHKPAYNSRSKVSANNAKFYRIFNTGKFGSLLPEVSGLYYVGDSP